MTLRDLAIGAVCIAVVTACASGGGAPPAVGASGRSCSVDKVDSTFAALGQVYRDCDVDRMATRIATGAHPDLAGVTARPCMSADVEFVVDENGRVISAPVVVVRATSTEFGDAIAATVGSWRYQPAEKDGHPVRQIVKDHEMVQTRTVVVRQGSSPPPMSGSSEPMASC